MDFGKAQFYFGTPIDNIESEEIGTCAGIEVRQDAGNADKKVKCV